MKILNYLRTFTVGEWIALVTLSLGSLIVLWGVLSTLLGGLLQDQTSSGVMDVDMHDLLAQQNMVAAAWWMVGLTAFSIGIGALSLFLIFRTLQEAKRSADAAQSAVQATMLIGKRQIRAYLDIENVTAKIDRLQFVLSVDARLANSGQSPARAIRGIAVLRFIEFYSLPEGDMGTDVLSERTSEFTTSAVSAGKDVGLFLTFGLFDLRPPARELFDDFSHRAMQIDVSLEYVDVFDDTSTMRRMLGAVLPSLEAMREGISMRVSSSGDD